MNIKGIINKIKKEYDTYDIDILIHKLGVKLEYYNRKELGIDVDAFSYNNTIAIDESVEGHYLEFLKYHELGHLIIHNDMFNLPLAFSSYGSKYEREANTFAIHMIAKRYAISDKQVIVFINDRYHLNF